ncbi:RNA-binding protein [Bacillus canaveralius]|uniref:RNA-binding protein n=1 Tax=Bacillus canaveralius TaxID=1403243 RepID=A0A2N5GNQ7_9BACI|nr:RNA-binding protein [Bacillus canaveralius]PLR84135.1 RNA-binding protein [Bacillus canaveralius]PLR96219.1 RNA-binding protein [Bacillus canaveralius]
MSIYQHFRPEERDFIDLVHQWKDYVESTYSAKLTDFLDPREQQIVTTILGRHAELQFGLFGGSETTERQRAIFYPEYMSVVQEDFQISLFEIAYPAKFVTIEHRQVLGSLMSLGLKRGKFGDILVDQDRVQFFAAKEIADYVRNQLQSVGKAAVRIEEIPLEHALSVAEAWSELSATISSLRLDTVIAGLYNLSRQKAQLLIQQGIVKVNWSTIESTSFECGAGDIISIKGYGRCKLISIEGKTKKDKWKITAGRQK